MRLDKLETTLPNAGTVMLYGERYPLAIAALLRKAPAHLTRTEADTLHRYRYKHDPGYREISDRPVPTRALEVMLEALVRKDFVTTEGYEDLPGEVACDLLARPDTSLEAQTQARRYLEGNREA